MSHYYWPSWQLPSCIKNWSWLHLLLHSWHKMPMSLIMDWPGNLPIIGGNVSWFQLSIISFCNFCKACYKQPTIINKHIVWMRQLTYTYDSMDACGMMCLWITQMPCFFDFPCSHVPNCLFYTQPWVTDDHDRAADNILREVVLSMIIMQPFLWIRTS